MIKTRKKAFQRAHDLLCEVREFGRQSDGYATTTPQQIASLKALRKLRTREISRAERKVRGIKGYFNSVASDTPHIQRKTALRPKHQTSKHLHHTTIHR